MNRGNSWLQYDWDTPDFNYEDYDFWKENERVKECEEDGTGFN